MDVSMPFMGGMEATEIIRAFEKDKAIRRTPIIALTAHAMIGDRERCIQAGMVSILELAFGLVLTVSIGRTRYETIKESRPHERYQTPRITPRPSLDSSIYLSSRYLFAVSGSDCL